METTILYIILAVLILTTIYVLVRTLIFQWSAGSVEKVEGIPVDEQEVAEHLAAAVRCKTVPLDDNGTPDPQAFQQLHRIDVVSADPTEWTHPSFEGVITGGYIWGRGTLDIKNQLIGIMEAAEALLQQGWSLTRR